MKFVAESWLRRKSKLYWHKNSYAILDGLAEFLVIAILAAPLLIILIMMSHMFDNMTP